MNAKTSFFLAALVLAGSAGLQASERILGVTEETLSDWSVSGFSDATPFGKFLPAGSQIARTFDSVGVSINIKAQPIFTSEPADWAVLEIGPAALVFVRSGDEGRAKLIVGNGAPVDLPFSCKIDSDGRAATILQLRFGLVNGVVTVASLEKVLSVPVDGGWKDSAEVVISAGGGIDFPVGELEIILTEADRLVDRSGHASGAVTTTGPAKARDSARGFMSSPSFWSTGSDGHEVKREKPANKEESRDAVVIFTPPAVRHGKADAIRSLVEKQLN